MNFKCLMVLAVGLTGCAGVTRGDPGQETPTDPALLLGDADGLSFASQVHPLLLSGCQSCHQAGAAASNTALVLTGDSAHDYAQATALIDEGAPAGSRLLTKASGKAHSGGAIFPTSGDDYQTLLMWVQTGALP